jgi:hypothetical protein
MSAPVVAHTFLSLASSRAAALICMIALLLSSCGTPAVRPDLLADALGLERIELRGTLFVHTAYRVTLERSTGTRLWVFIDGDGRPWVNGGREPASDPTTRHPLALQLAAKTMAPALYLGRPCYDRAPTDEACTSTWWTDARYSDAVVASMVAALRSYQSQNGFERIVLVGYSGGGTLAVLMAPRLPNLDGVVTIAANLDVSAWAEHHHYLPLLNSLNPADRVGALRVPEIHLMGERDTTVPPITTQRYFEAHPAALMWTYAQFDHLCCWQREWPEIHERIERALNSKR